MKDTTTVDQTLQQVQAQTKPLTDAANNTAQTAQYTAAEAADSMQDDRPLIVGAAGKFILAAIGAVGLAQDSLEALLDRMVKRGEISQKDAKKLVNELRAKRPHLRSVAKDVVPPAVEEELPTKADIQALNDQIAALSAKIDRLNKSKPELPHS